jgi:hypothetical protein
MKPAPKKIRAKFAVGTVYHRFSLQVDKKCRRKAR